jgi:hypothetical protein
MQKHTASSARHALLTRAVLAFFLGGRGHGECQSFLWTCSPQQEWQYPSRLYYTYSVCCVDFVATFFARAGDDALEPHQLQEVAAGRSGGHITLVAIDATWAGAVKMRRKYPPGEGF